MILDNRKRNGWIHILMVLVIQSSILLTAQTKLSGITIMNTSTTTEISQYGITWFFSEPVQFGTYVNGDYWVMGPVEIVTIEPAAGLVDGDYKNGSMINPVASSSERQAYDSRQSAYVSTLNVALGVNPTNPLLLQPGESLVSTISRDGDSHTVLQSGAVLTVVDSAPQSGEFRPPYSGTAKPKYNESQLRLDRLLSLPLPGSAPSISEVAEYFRRPWIDHVPFASGSQFHPYENMPWYGREMATQVGIGALMLLGDGSPAEKRNLLIRYVQLGIDLYGIVDNATSFIWTPDGGHSSGRKWPIIFAGLMLDVNEMQNIGAGDGTGRTFFGEDAQTFYVSNEEVVITNGASWNPDTRQPTQPYNSSHIGMAEWGIRHATNPEMDNANWLAIYRQCCTASAWGGFVLAARLMDAVTIWDHQELFDYQDRYMHITSTGEDPNGYDIDGLVDGWRATSNFVEDMWDLYR